MYKYKKFGGSWKSQKSVHLFIASWLILVSNISWSSYLIAEYFPIPEGARWYYTDGHSSWVDKGWYKINGVLTRKIKGKKRNKMYVSNDDNGLRLHREGDDEVNKYTSPVVMSNAIIALGDKFFSQGKMEKIWKYKKPSGGGITLLIRNILTSQYMKFWMKNELLCRMVLSIPSK